jgi:Zn-finger nucleic acid-binding protein
MTRRCPRCATALLAIDVGAGATIHACTACKGMFVPPRAWRHVLETPSLAEEIEGRLSALGAGIRVGAITVGDPPVACPTCARPMKRAPFCVSSEVTIDACLASGHGVWADIAELSRLVAFHETPFHRRRSLAAPAPEPVSRTNTKNAVVFAGFFAVLLGVSAWCNHVTSSRMQQSVDRAAAQGEQQLR